MRRSLPRFPLLFCLLAACAALASPGRAQEEPPALESDEQTDGNFLVIPGIGKIPLPPGVRAYGPGNQPRDRQGLAPRQYGPRAIDPGQAMPLSPEQQRVDEMNRLFAKLAEAEDDREAIAAAAAIQRRWSQSGSDTVDLLAARALAAQAGGARPLARSLLDYVVALAPRWPEGFVRRARLRAIAGDDFGALQDFEQAAQIDPRRFDALRAIGEVAEKLGEKKRALDAYRKALAVTPREETLRKNEERLKVEVEGRDI